MLALSFHPSVVSGAICETFRDEFSSTSYSRQDGTLNWSTDWIEVGDDNAPNNGSIRIASNAIELRGGGATVTVLGGPFIQREANLSGFDSATLTFDYMETGNWEPDDDIEIYVSNDGGASWNLIQTFTDDQGSTYQPFSFDISAYISANTRIAFVEKADSNGERFYIDNVEIQACITTVAPLAFYEMNEASWNGTPAEAFDSSASGNHGTAVGNATTVNPGKICRGGDIPFNNTDVAQDALDSGLDMDADIGTAGSISLWFKPDTDWTGGGDRMLIDASTTADNKYFFLVLLDTGVLRFRFEDSIDADFQLDTSAKAFAAGIWHHIAITWDLPGDRMEIYIDGVLDASLITTSSGAWGALGSVYFGDNRSTYHPSGTAASANGVIDEARIYNLVQTATEIQTDMNATGSCATPYAWFQLDASPGTWNGSAGEVVDQIGNVTTASALGTGAGVNSITTPICRGIDIPFNNTDAAQYGFDSRIDADDDIGNSGSISFWYRSDNNWAGGGDRALFDASPDNLGAPDKFFLLMLRNDGALQFAVEDSVDNDFLFNTAVQGFLANVWVHIAVTWNMSGSREIYINGSLAATDATATSGSLGELNTIYFGDNRSTYHFGGTSSSANGTIDEVRVYSTIQTPAEIQSDMNATHACSGPLLDHFSITPATVNASTCLANAITIIAEDAGNGPVTSYTDQVNISVSSNHGNWSVNNADNVTNPNPDNDDNGAVSYTYVLSDAGEIVLNLTNTHAESLTITVTDTVTSISSTSVVIAYSSNVFVITEDPLQIAGKPQAMTIAMWTDNLVGICGIDTNYNYSSRSLEASIDRAGVLPAAPDPSIGVIAIPDGPASATILLDFSITPGQASFNLDTTDVGQYRLAIEDTSNTHSDSVISGASNLLTVRPFGLAVTNIVETATLDANPAGTAPADTEFAPAGADFSARVAGVLWVAGDDLDSNGVLDAGQRFDNNAPAPNYAWNTTLSVSGLGYTPITGVPGALNNGVVPLAGFAGGFANLNNLQYTEVGSFTLIATADDYLGVASADIVGDSNIIIGRFTPASFRVTIDNNGALEQTCAAYTYIGEDFNYATVPLVTVAALNALSPAGITTNYRDDGGINDFVRLDANSITLDASQDDTTPGSDAGPLLVSYTRAAMTPVPNNDGTVTYTFGADTYRYGPDLPLSNFSKFSNSLVAPFPADINPEITAVSDGEISTSFAATTYVLNPTANNLRFGRLQMDNVHGSELNPLVMPAYTEFWDGIAFRRNLLDTCTLITTGDLTIVTASPPGLSVPSVAFSPASAGNVNVDFPAPGASNVGYIDIITDLSSAAHLWLRYDWDADSNFDNDPGARATFGIYEGNPVQIFIQQIYQ